MRSYPIFASTLADHMIAALKTRGAERIDVGMVDTHEITAVFKIFKYRDDVHIMIIPEGNHSTLFIRSASREGFSDLGVNKRRIRRILKTIDKHIKRAG